MNLKKIFTAALAAGALSLGASTIFAQTGAQSFASAWNGAADTVDDATYTATTQNPAAVNGIVTSAFEEASRPAYPSIVVAAIRGLEKMEMDSCENVIALTKHAIEAAAPSGKMVVDDMGAAILDAAMEEKPECIESLNGLGEMFGYIPEERGGGLGADGVLPLIGGGALPPGSWAPPTGGSGFDNPERLPGPAADDDGGDRPVINRPIIIVPPTPS